MSRLEELLRELCPDGVEYKTISEFAQNENGKNKGMVCNRAFSITQRGLIPTSEFFKEAKVTSDDTSGYKLVKHNWFVYSPSRIDVGSINYLRELEDVIVSPLNVVFSVDEEIIRVDYLLYFLQSRSGTWQILNNRQGIEGTGRKLLPFDKFGTISVPVPPLSVQEEIVRILNCFTQLTAELKAELTARKKQYEYYRNELLSFDEDVPMLTLPDISTNCDRQRKPVTKGNREAGEYPYYGASGIVDYVANYLFDGEYLLVSEDGANLLARSTPIAFSISGKNWVNNHAHVLQFETYEMQKYVEIYLNSMLPPLSPNKIVQPAEERN